MKMGMGVKRMSAAKSDGRHLECAFEGDDLAGDAIMRAKDLSHAAYTDRLE